MKYEYLPCVYTHPSLQILLTTPIIISDVAEIQSTSYDTIEDLKSKLGEMERELAQVESYRREKDQHMEKIAALEKIKADLETEMIETIDRLERKNLEEKAQVYKDLDAQKVLFREVAMREARAAMGADFHKVSHYITTLSFICLVKYSQTSLQIYRDNERMHEEIKFHRQMADDQISEKKSLEENLSAARRELEIVKDNEQEYVRQGLVRTKEIKALRERVEQLEKQQIVNVERFKARSKELQTSVYKELEDATLDAAGLRRLIKIKNKELRTMKTLSATILSQRNDVEQFFLEALSEVKELIKKQRRQTRGTADGRGPAFGRTTTRGLPAASSKKLGTLPSIKGVNQSLLEDRGASNIPNLDGEVDIRELGWEDKELVLRVLFAKMNGHQDMMNRAISESKRKATTADGSNTAVFISEGAEMPKNEFVDYNEKNYMVVEANESYADASIGVAGSLLEKDDASALLPPSSPQHASLSLGE